MAHLRLQYETFVGNNRLALDMHALKPPIIDGLRDLLEGAATAPAGQTCVIILNSVFRSLQ